MLLLRVLCESEGGEGRWLEPLPQEEARDEEGVGYQQELHVDGPAMP